MAAITTTLAQELDALRPLMAQAAQDILDAWEQDEGGADDEYGFGGVCDAIDRALCEVVTEHLEGVELVDGGQDGDEHAYSFVLRLSTQEACMLDLPWSIYEVRNGFWQYRKVEGVVIEPQDFDLHRLPHDWYTLLADQATMDEADW